MRLQYLGPYGHRKTYVRSRVLVLVHHAICLVLVPGMCLAGFQHMRVKEAAAPAFQTDSKGAAMGRIGQSEVIARLS